jgi:hypothetical protein
MSLYHLVNGVNPATFLILPMMGKHPDEYPRFRDCFISKDKNILILTRCGGPNRGEFGDEWMAKLPNFVKTYDAEDDNSYAFYEYTVPEEWKEDFNKILAGENPSEKYVDQMCKVFPKLEEEFRTIYADK